MLTASNPDQAFQRCQQLAERYLNDFGIENAFDLNPGRFETLSAQAPHVFGDLSKCMWDETVIEALRSLACEQGLEAKKSLLFEGGVLNLTENRRVEHVLLRKQGISALTQMLELAEQIRASYPTVTDVVHLGIGGSSLGPELAVDALQDFKSTPIELHFVSNVDGAQLHRLFKKLNPETTLIVAVSKSWSTLETLENLKLAMSWLSEGGVANPGAKVVAITAQPEKAKAFGVNQVIDFSEGIGGRFSIWSGVGFALALSIGRDGFDAFLAGAREMDAHFESADTNKNLPTLLGFLDVWNHAFLGYSSRCVVPYTEQLKLLPAYLQQLEMESNGKSASLSGGMVKTPTAPVVWGSVGTTSQHAFFQCLHQGTSVVPIEFLLLNAVSHPFKALHKALNLNTLAQAKALMQGRECADWESESGSGLHTYYPGNRPSHMLVLYELTPKAVGALFALYEHKTFVFGVLTGINSFDQFGVELGKQIALQLESSCEPSNGVDVDGSTLAMINRLICT